MHPALLKRPDRLPTAGLVALYDFVKDDAFPQRLTDRSGNGNHATLGSNASATDTNDPTWAAQGLLFDGADDYVLTPNLPVSRLLDYTVIVAAERTSQARQPLFSHPVDTANRNGIAFESGELRGGYYNGTAYVARSAAITLGNHLVALRVAGGVPGLFLNGAAPVTGVGSPYLPSTPANVGMIGRTEGTVATNNGRIYCLAIYSRALSDAEITRAHRVIKKQLVSAGITI